MPELPEVQTVTDALRQAGIVGRKVIRAKIRWPKTVSETTPSAFCRRIKDQTITSIRRRGKYIVIEFQSADCLITHLRMTGRMLLADKKTPVSKHVHVVLDLDDTRCLHFHDTRKFGRMHLTCDPGAVLAKLGVEPLSSLFTARKLAEICGSRNRMIKPLLLDQAVIAGLGNIYVDESLWIAKIHPLRTSATLTDREIKALHRSIRSALRKGIKNNGTSLGTGKTNFVSAGNGRGRNQLQLKVFRRTGLPCPRCGHPVLRIIVGQRSTHICEVCQQI